MAVFVEAEFTDILFCGSPKEKQALELVSLSHSRHESTGSGSRSVPLS